MRQLCPRVIKTQFTDAAQPSRPTFESSSAHGHSRRADALFDSVHQASGRDFPLEKGKLAINVFKNPSLNHT